MKEIRQIYNFLKEHPLTRGHSTSALFRFARWQVMSRLRERLEVPFVGDSRLVVKKGMVGATGNIYVGLAEFPEMSFLLHVLRPGDLFVDAGANVGVFTVLASAVAGADSVAFEPVPETFHWLEENVRVNKMTQKVRALNMGLGEESSTIHFTKNLDSVNHVVMNPVNTEDTIPVKVDRLDVSIAPRFPFLMKIDVEGFEYQVINGATRVMENPTLSAIIIELNGSGRRYGIEDKQIKERLEGYGFKPHYYEPLSRNLFSVDETWKGDNVIYIRNEEVVRDRIRSADKINVLNHRF
ncbi:MAG: FkbM family methyltransferase [Flavobacteriales bacterium]|nr:FkbM family methyltransferase [Flavobacteriales bacterium]